MNILVITPWVPYPITGADQQDRFQGFLQLQKLGHNIHVLAKIRSFQPRDEVERFYAQAGIPLTLVPYVSHPFRLLLTQLPAVLCEPALLDGSALEYTDPHFVRTLDGMIGTFRPDAAWIDFCFLWPALRQLHRRGIPVIMRSANNEAQQSIDEHGGSLFARIRAIPKFRGEKIVARESDVLLAITPWEEEWYRRSGAKNPVTLPLRGLPPVLRRRVHHPKEQLDVVFLSSSYTNGHNRDALRFILTQVIPSVCRQMPGVFRFHITGRKFPKSFRSFLQEDVQLEGFVPDISAFLDTMDIALCPSLTGQGMQQKIFEPLCCGLPLITHHTAGYAFVHGEHVLLAQTPEQYVVHLSSLRDVTRRQALADAAYVLAHDLFSEDALLTIQTAAIRHAVQNT